MSIKPNQSESNRIKPVNRKSLWHTELQGAEWANPINREWTLIDANDSDDTQSTQSNPVKPRVLDYVIRGKDYDYD